MARPQLEDGHTRIANEILEHLATIHLSANQWQVLLCIIRKTYGYQKKVDHIANSQICEATGLCKAVVSRALHDLEDMGVINRQGKLLGLQKDWERWKKLAILQTSEPKEPPRMRIVRTDGYIGIWRGAVEPEFQSMATKQGYILEHRLIMARSQGRCLEPWEVVHHKGTKYPVGSLEDKQDNRDENLELLPSQTEHMPSILAQQRIKQLEAELAQLQTPVDDKLAVSPSTLAVSSSTVAKSSTKVSSPAVTQKKKETYTKETIQKKEKFILPIWIDKDTWEAFLEMRKKKRAIPTERAKQLLVKELEKLRGEGNDPNEVLNQSIMRNYTGVFPLKGGQGEAHRGHPRQLRPRGTYTRPEEY